MGENDEAPCFVRHGQETTKPFGPDADIFRLHHVGTIFCEYSTSLLQWLLVVLRHLPLDYADGLPGRAISCVRNWLFWRTGTWTDLCSEVAQRPLLASGLL